MKPENQENFIKLYKRRKTLQYFHNSGIDEVIQITENMNAISINNFHFSKEDYPNMIMEIEGVLIRARNELPRAIKTLDIQIEEIL